MKIVKKCIVIIFALLLPFENFAAIVSDNDGIAFVTKAEFDILKNSFAQQITDYNKSIDGKIDGAIASYLSGIAIQKVFDEEILWQKDEKLIYCLASDEVPVPKACYPALAYTIAHLRDGSPGNIYNNTSAAAGVYLGTLNIPSSRYAVGSRLYIDDEPHTAGATTATAYWMGQTNDYFESWNFVAIGRSNGNTFNVSSTFYFSLIDPGLTSGYYSGGFVNNSDCLREVTTGNAQGYLGYNAANQFVGSIDIDNKKAISSTDKPMGIYKLGLITYGDDTTSRPDYFSVLDSKEYYYEGNAVSGSIALKDIQKILTISDTYCALHSYRNARDYSFTPGVCTGDNSILNLYMPQLGFAQNITSYSQLKSSVFKNLAFGKKIYDEVFLYNGLPFCTVNKGDTIEYKIAFSRNEEKVDENPAIDTEYTYNLYASLEPFTNSTTPDLTKCLDIVCDGITSKCAEIKGEKTITIKIPEIGDDIDGYLWFKWTEDRTKRPGGYTGTNFVGGGNLIVDANHRSFKRYLAG